MFVARNLQKKTLQKVGIRRFLTLSVSVMSLFVCTSSFAAGKDKCEAALRGAVIDDCTTNNLSVGKNTEQAASSDNMSWPFIISVDGQSVAEGGKIENGQRQTDVALDAVNIQVKFDGLDAKQILSVRADTKDNAQSNTVHFVSSSNYEHFIARREIRIFDAKIEENYKVTDADPVAIIAMNSGGTADWNADGKNLKNSAFVLRAYDDKGHFDETLVQPFVEGVVNLQVASKAELDTLDMVRVRNIPVYGGAVTVFGRNIPDGYGVKVLGATINTDDQHQFLFQQILPSGDHDIDIGVSGGKDEGLQFVRQINIPNNDWFYVGLADFTVGRRFGDQVVPASNGEFAKTYTKGRLAFYLKGKIKGKYLLTASADTREGELGSLLKGFSLKDSRSLLRRLDPDDYYPIYGDDSTIVEDAPTSGKAYVRLERGESHVMWGNFKTTISGTEFAQNQRGLYGAHLLYKSEQQTSFAAPKSRVEAYAAQPGTIPQRDDLLGTSGSAYFLKHQDINPGSEQIVIERRDAISGRVISRVPLKETDDYRLDYIQGVIILSQPLDSVVASYGAIQGGPNAGDTLHLVVNYETSPTLGQEDGQTYGARGEQWLGDHVLVGGTATQETVSSATNRKIEADVTLRKSEKTEIQFEVAQSEGRGIGQSFSTDGGLTYKSEAVAGAAGAKALAYRMKAKADLGEITQDRLKGSLEAYYELRKAGFSALDSETLVDRRLYGVGAIFGVADNVLVRVGVDGVDSSKDDLGNVTHSLRAKIETEAQIAENWTLVAGVSWSHFADPAAKQYSNGDRADIGARLTYTVNKDTNIYAFAQKTLHKTGDRLNNDRVGLGGETQLNERFGVAGEVSYGNSGIGGSAALTYKRDSDNSYYFGYKLDPDRDIYTDPASQLLGTDAGVIVVGANSKLNDWTSAFTETNVDLFGKSHHIGQIYGLTFMPDDVWSTSLGMSISTIKDPKASDFDRKAASMRIGYTTDELTASLNGEVRVERSEDNTRDRDTYLVQAAANWKTADNWRLLASLDAVLSNSDQGSILNGKYVEASIGAAYRPVDNDKLNMLFKYTYLYDLPAAQQVTSTGGILGVPQRSNILSVDATYDVNEWFSVGGKYGFRTGSISQTRDPVKWENSTVHLGIIRADIAIVKKWDLLAEARVLYGVQNKQTDYGFLAAAYRHFGNNMKVGVGYNFGTFSDDLADITHDDKGVFFNVIGKF